MLVSEKPAPPCQTGVREEDVTVGFWGKGGTYRGVLSLEPPQDLGVSLSVQWDRGPNWLREGVP